MIKKIALLAPGHEISSFEINRIQALFKPHEITAKHFEESDDIDEFNPDCVIVLSPQEPKLTRFPTYGLLNKPVNEYLELPRFVRNLLTYDGYLTSSQELKQMVEDLAFGARKIGSNSAFFDFMPNKMAFNPPNISHLKLVYFEPEIRQTQFKNLIKLLQKKVSRFKLLSHAWGLYSSLELVKTPEELASAYLNAGIGLCLEPGDKQSKVISNRLLEIIASGAITITTYTKTLDSYFGENLFYISPKLNASEAQAEINEHLTWIEKNPEAAIEKAKKAHEILCAHFQFNSCIENLNQLHSETLVSKGFIPDKNEDVNALPSVSYIIRTGGKNREWLERALNSLVNQQYPKLHVLFVVHKDFDYLEELVAAYPSLKIKVIQSYKSQRSKAICEGMAAVETDLFGMLDDDDELSPNHVRTLIRTLQYHDKRDWRGPISMVYSGSIMCDKNNVFEYEQEFLDAKLKNSGKKRAVEHFRFYRPIQMANHVWYMMSNSWLAKRSIIDSELLTDPKIDTCEDLYFELQFAQRTHFAFSVELTVFHYFHSTNSTQVDESQHIPDNNRIALRNYFRSFCGEFQFDSRYNPAGTHAHIPSRTNFQDETTTALPYPLYKIENTLYPINSPQFCSSYQVKYSTSMLNIVNQVHTSTNITAPSKTKRNFISHLFLLPISFSLLREYEKNILVTKFKNYYSHNGLMATIVHLFRYDYTKISYLSSPTPYFTKFKVYMKQYGLLNAIKKTMKRLKPTHKRSTPKLRDN